MFERLLLLKQVPLKPDLGLLLLRIFAFTFLFLKHGAIDLSTFGALSHSFDDPIHIGHLPTLVLATLSDAICAVLIIVGLATRWAALYTFFVHFVAFAFVLHFTFISRHVPNGEKLLLYIGAGLALYFLGAGKYSVDAMIQGSREAKQASRGATLAA